jgi:hypothetical protein
VVGGRGRVQPLSNARLAAEEVGAGETRGIPTVTCGLASGSQDRFACLAPVEAVMHTQPLVPVASLDTLHRGAADAVLVEGVHHVVGALLGDDVDLIVPSIPRPTPRDECQTAAVW